MRKSAFVFLLVVITYVAYCQVPGRLSGCDAPSGNFSFTINNKTVTFSNSVVGATSWKWDFGDGNTSTSKEPANIYASYGRFNVCLTAFGDCAQALFCTTIMLAPPPQVVTAVEEFSESSVKIFPNPVINQLIVAFSGLLPENITIVNQSGSQLLSITGEEVRSSMCLDFSQYPVGAYLLTWTAAGRMQSSRVVKAN